MGEHIQRLRQVYESYYELSPCDALLSRVAVIKEHLISKCNKEAEVELFVGWRRSRIGESWHKENYHDDECGATVTGGGGVVGKRGQKNQVREVMTDAPFPRRRRPSIQHKSREQTNALTSGQRDAVRRRGKPANATGVWGNARHHHQLMDKETGITL